MGGDLRGNSKPRLFGGRFCRGKLENDCLWNRGPRSSSVASRVYKRTAATQRLGKMFRVHEMSTRGFGFTHTNITNNVRKCFFFWVGVLFFF